MPRRLPRKDSRFNKLIQLLAVAHSEDRDKLARYCVKEKGFTLQEVANVLGCTRENVRQMINTKYETD